MGSIFHVPLARTDRGWADRAGEAARRARSSARTSPPTRSTIARPTIRPPLILLMGNEQQGLTEKLVGGLRRAGPHSDARQGGFAQPRGVDGADDLRGAAARSPRQLGRRRFQAADALVHSLNLRMRGPRFLQQCRQRAVLSQHDRRQHLHVVAQAGDVASSAAPAGGQRKFRSTGSEVSIDLLLPSCPSSCQPCARPCGNAGLYSPRRAL